MTDKILTLKNKVSGKHIKQEFGDSVREQYLNTIYKFGLYHEVIPAVGEGWNQ